MSERYLLIKHSEGWNVDRCCHWMNNNNKSYDWFYPIHGGAFPEVRDYHGVIIFGGAPSANDDETHDWVLPELSFIEDCLKHDVGFFGICLGAQMLARVLGAKISKHPDGAHEIGQCIVEPTEAGRFFLPHPMTVMQWHREGFELPAQATNLARSDVFENQAFQLNERVFGVQFHPEVNPESLAIWQKRNQKKSPNEFTDEQRDAMMATAVQHDEIVSTWLNGFLNYWGKGSQNIYIESASTGND